MYIYKYYFKALSDKPLIEEFKNVLRDETQTTENWSDLELELGKYIESLSTLDDFDDLLGDIRECLTEYLIEIEQSFRDKVYSSLESPNTCLNEAYSVSSFPR